MRLALAVGLLVLVAPPSFAQDSTAKPAKPPKKQPTVIAAWEIRQIEGQAQNAYEVVKLLRPRFFQVRSRESAGNAVWNQGPGVLIDEAPRGGIEFLRSIPLTAIREIRYVSGPDAASRYGVEYHAGAILVVTQ